MSNQTVANKIQADLVAAVGSGLLPENAQSKAEQVLHRLKQPVRITILGLPGSGKSSLLNLLVGSDALPQDVQLPTTQLTYGDAPKTICTLPDGTKQELAHADANEIAALSPVFVEMELPLAALGKISVLEVVAHDDQTELRRALRWASKRSDVTLWCTQAFGATEQALWGEMPDNIKDHAFLMVTKADALLADGVMQSNLETIKSIATEEFNQILPIATTNAIAARKPDGSVDKEQMRASGGLALISAVLRQVDQGRQSAVGMADILLRQNSDVLNQAATEPTSEPDVADETPTPEVVSESVTAADTRPTLRTVADTETSPSVAASVPETPSAPVSEPEASNVIVLRPETRDAYEHVLDYIKTQSSELITMTSELGDEAPARVMAKTVEHVQWLSEYLNEHGAEGDPALERARDSAMDAADLIQLMQMEKRDSAAAEAISVMIQIKRELQADIVA